MMGQTEIAAKCQDVRQLIDTRLGVRGHDLSQALRRTGRLLPRRVRAQAGLLVAAQEQAGHPRLARQVDPAAVAVAHAAVVAHLSAIDAADARRGRMLSLAGVIAFNLLAVAAGFVFWLWWKGYV